MYGRQRGQHRAGGLKGRILIAAVIAAISLISYFSSSQFNPITNEKQHISMSKEQEIALGLQAAPKMVQQHGGEHADPALQAKIDEIGNRIVARSTASKSEYKFEFTLLADPETINAFALPGGQVFMTMGLLKRLNTDGEMAGVLGHEVGHVIARHSAEHLAKAQLTQGLTGAAVIASYDPDNPASGQRNAAIAAAVGHVVNLRYGRDDEIESDKLGIRFMAEAGYDPRSMIRVMEVLRDAAKGARQPEFFSTHPNPDRRLERIQSTIDETFPEGVPENLQK